MTSATSQVTYSPGEPKGHSGIRPVVSALSITATGAALLFAVPDRQYVGNTQSVELMEAKPSVPMWVSDQLAAISGLGVNWDGYGAEPIAPGIVAQMRALLHRALKGFDAIAGNIVPGADGSLQAEWHFEDISFALLIEDSGVLSCWVRPVGAHVEIERHNYAALALFRDIATRFFG